MWHTFPESLFPRAMIYHIKYAPSRTGFFEENVRGLVFVRHYTYVCWFSTSYSIKHAGAEDCNGTLLQRTKMVHWDNMRQFKLNFPGIVTMDLGYWLKSEPASSDFFPFPIIAR
jgi:hypothetical protein